MNFCFFMYFKLKSCEKGERIESFFLLVAFGCTMGHKMIV